MRQRRSRLKAFIVLAQMGMSSQGVFADELGRRDYRPFEEILLANPSVNGWRREYLLEEAPAAKVTDVLKNRYPGLVITEHPIYNGFYVRADSDTHNRLSREVSQLDTIPEPVPPPTRLFEWPVTIHAIPDLFGYLAPYSQFIVDAERNRLIVFGPDVMRMKSIFSKMPRPPYDLEIFYVNGGAQVLEPSE